MQPSSQKILRLALALALYLLIKHVLPIGPWLLYPVTLIVTILHELGHGLMALLTGGSIEGIQINSDGSGFCTTRGGNAILIVMGGYLGSAFFGNALLYIGAKRPQRATIVLYVLVAMLLITAVLWFNSLGSTLILLVFALAFYALARYTRFHADPLLFIGLASIIHIIEDFRVGPSSDLESYARLLPILPAAGWMYVWLVLALLMLAYNLRLLLRR